MFFYFLQVSPLKLYMNFWTAPYVLCALPISVFSIKTQIMLGEQYNAFSSTLCNFLHFPVISSFLAPNIFLSTLFSNTLNLCSSLNVRDKVSQPYNTIGNIIVLYLIENIYALKIKINTSEYSNLQLLDLTIRLRTMIIGLILFHNMLKSVQMRFYEAEDFQN